MNSDNLPRLPLSWHYAPLGTLVDSDRGISYGVVQPGQPVPNGIPIVRVNNFRGGTLMLDEVLRVDPQIEAAHSRTRLRGGEVLITLVGSVGEVAIASPDLVGWNTARAVGVIPVREELGARWVSAWLRTPSARACILKVLNTTVQATLNLKDLANIPVPIADDHDRNTILSVLNPLDDKIELNRRKNEALEEITRAIFKSWFVDFDPVRIKMEGRDPGFAPNIAALFPDRLTTDDLPEGWLEGRLGDIVANIVERCSPSEVTRAKPYVPIDAIAARSVILSDSRPGSEAQSSLVAFREGDILFGAMRPYFHKVALAPFEGTTRTTVFVLRPHLHDDIEYALATISADSTIDFATAHSTGSTIPYAVWTNSMETMPVVVPPKEVRAEYGRLVRPLLDRALIATNQSKTLASLRDLLLPKLMSGQIRVKDAEGLLGQAGV